MIGPTPPLPCEEYCLAATASNDGLWTWNLEEDKVFYSDRWFEMMGYRPGELPPTPKTWFSRVHQDDVKSLERQLDQLITGTIDVIHQECRLRHRTGRTLWVTLRSLSHKDKTGRVIRLVGAQTDISERRRIEEQLSRDAFHDPLTKLPNRMLFSEYCQKAFARYKRDKKAQFAVFFIDIDHFKQINDTLGHAAGDELLITLSERMKHCCREIDTVARFAGDEFVILISDHEGPSDVIQVAERLVKELHNPILLNGQEIHPSASIGVAFADPSYEEPGDLLSSADLALYQAKEKGRNQFVVFDRANQQEMAKPLRYKSDFKGALHKEEFNVYFQGIFDVSTNDLCGFEALARWHHPELGTVMPKDFLSLAEKSGKIAEIDRQIFEDSIRQVALWKKVSGKDLFVSFNLSSSALLKASLKGDLQSLLHKNTLTPHNVILEIPEKIAYDSLSTVSKNLHSLKEAGFRIALDDFGADISSLSALPSLPLNILKVDRSLVTNLHKSTKTSKALNLIALVARHLQLNIIFKGVEKTKELEYLRKEYQGMVQGYYFQKPVSAQEMEALYPELSSHS